MILSDALSRRPDHCPNDDTDNEDIVMLPNDLFINLIDVDLQERIENIDKMDKDAEGALSILSEQGPDTLRNRTEDWTLE